MAEQILCFNINELSVVYSVFVGKLPTRAYYFRDSSFGQTLHVDKLHPRGVAEFVVTLHQLR